MSMCVHVYVCLCVCMCTYVYVCARVRMSTCVHVYVCLRLQRQPRCVRCVKACLQQVSAVYIGRGNKTFRTPRFYRLVYPPSYLQSPFHTVLPLLLFHLALYTTSSIRPSSPQSDRYRPKYRTFSVSVVVSVSAKVSAVSVSVMLVSVVYRHRALFGIGCIGIGPSFGITTSLIYAPRIP